MKSLLPFLGLLVISCNQTAVQNKENEPVTTAKVDSVGLESMASHQTIIKSKDPLDYVPEGYVLYTEDGFDELKGDLNKDGVDDLVIMIKGTDKSKFFKDEYRGELDRNRRGLIVLFDKGDYYEPACVNYQCFSSEQEDGGNYFPPDLVLSIERGNLYIRYLHGRYGGWDYTFRYQHGDFELIGYDSHHNRGPVPQSVTSVNFLTKKMLYQDNLNKDVYGDDYTDDKFIDTWTTLDIKYLMKLSEIKDFDEIDFDFLR